ncbi:MAG: hypothetical protein ACOCWM_02995 [Cyclobacteriaceae bacterium]
MRKIVLLCVVALMPMVVSANMPDENEKLYLKLSTNEIEAAPNQKLVITGNAFSKKGINCIYLYEDGKFKDFWKRETLQFIENHDFEYSFVAPNTKIEKTMKIIFEMVDDESNKSVQELIVKVMPKEEPKPVVVKEEPKPESKPEPVEEKKEYVKPLDIIKSKVVKVILENGEGKSFYSAADKQLYSINEIKTQKQRVSDLLFGYYYGETNLASLTSLEEFPREVYNIDASLAANESFRKVKFMETDLTPDEFVQINGEDHDKIAEVVAKRAKTKGGKMIQLQAGQVIAFLEDNGSQGLIHVKNILPTYNSNGNIELDIIMQN